MGPHEWNADWSREADDVTAAAGAAAAAGCSAGGRGQWRLALVVWRLGCHGNPDDNGRGRRRILASRRW